MKNRALVEALNRMLAQDEASAAAVASRLGDIPADESVHGGRFRQRVLAPGGIPTWDCRRNDRKAVSLGRGD
jgi:hypothetical protein